MTSDVLVYTAAEVAELARVTEWTVAYWTRRGILPRLPGHAIRIPAAAVHELLEGRYSVPDEPDRQAPAKEPTSRRGDGRPPNGQLASQALRGGGALPRQRGPSEGDVVVRRVTEGSR